MVNYRRNFIPGGTYFFTVALRDRHSNRLVEHVDALREVFRKPQEARPFEINAVVIPPEPA
jgi:putative transposase